MCCSLLQVNILSRISTIITNYNALYYIRLLVFYKNHYNDSSSSSNKEGLEQSLAKMMILFVHANPATTEQVHGTVEGGQQLTLA